MDNYGGSNNAVDPAIHGNQTCRQNLKIVYAAIEFFKSLPFDNRTLTPAVLS